MDFPVVTYHSANAKPAESWIAYVVLSNGEYWLVRCVGPTEDAATERARNLYSGELARAKRLQSPEAYRRDNELGPKPKPEGGWTTAPAGHHSGKLWVLNRSTGHRARIDASEFAGYQTKGYVKAGPRSR